MKASLSNYRQSPRKVAIVADLIRGKKVSAALDSLRFTTRRATDPIEKLLRSAIANAKQAGIENPEDLFVNDIQVNKGIIMKRFMPRAHGSASPIWKRSSHITISLGEKIGKGKKGVEKANKGSTEVTVTEVKEESASKKKAVKELKDAKTVKAKKVIKK